MSKKAVVAFVLVAAVPAFFVGGARPIGAQGDNPQAPKQILKTFEYMEFLVQPVFEELRETAAKEPEGRKQWKALYRGTFATAELMNLLFSRSDEEYMAEADWPLYSANTRQAAEAMGAAVKEQDFALAKERYLAMVESCNACHSRFMEDDAELLEPWPEDE